MTDFSWATPQTHSKLNTHSVWAPLQQDIDGSVDIPIAIVQCDHRLILVLARDVNQLQNVHKKQATHLE